MKLFGEHFESFLGRITRGVGVGLAPGTVQAITERAVTKLPNHVPVLFPYMDRALGLQETLRVRMEQMTSRKFERVLHPIFEEDELTLVLAGAALGFAAGLVQQGLETGQIRIPKHPWKSMRSYVARCVALLRQWRPNGQRMLQRLWKPVRQSVDRCVLGVQQWRKKHAKIDDNDDGTEPNIVGDSNVD